VTYNRSDDLVIERDHQGMVELCVFRLVHSPSIRNRRGAVALEPNAAAVCKRVSSPLGQIEERAVSQPYAFLQSAAWSQSSSQPLELRSREGWEVPRERTPGHGFVT
jgi:hypothetical protein